MSMVAWQHKAQKNEEMFTIRADNTPAIAHDGGKKSDVTISALSSLYTELHMFSI